MSKKKGSVLIFTILFINTFCIISVSTLTIIVKKQKFLYENEERLKDSELEKKIEMYKGVVKSNIELIDKNINIMDKVIIDKFDKDEIYVENNIVKIYIHKENSYYYIYEFEYKEGGGLKYLRNTEGTREKVL